MPRRGGLGRGLDSLIPDRVGNRVKQKVSQDGPDEISSGEKLPKGNPPKSKDDTGFDTETDRKEQKSSVEDSSQPDSLNETGSLNNGISSDKSIVELRISEVEPNRSQPRQIFDEDGINELADSISKYGVISPLLVQKKDHYYEIIAGERRWRAAKKAGLKRIPVIIKNLSGREAVEISLIENIQREDLNPMEEAKAYERLVSEFGMKQEEVASRVSKSRSAVTNSMRLLKLQPDVQQMVEDGKISEGHARTIVSVDDPELQTEIAKEIVEQQLSVRQTEMLVRELQQPLQKKKPKPKPDLQRSALFDELANNLKGKFGTKVNIKPSGKSKGRIEIEYYSDEDLDRIYDLLQSVHE